LLRDLDHALPAGERANTDEDIARFVRKLLGDKLEERRATLSDALTRADQNTESRLRMPIPSLPSSSSVSAVGLAQSMLPLDGHGTAATELTGFHPDRRWKLIAGGVGVAFCLLLLSVIFLRSTSEPKPGTSSLAPSAAPPPVLPARQEPPATQTDVEPLSVEKPASSSRMRQRSPQGVRAGHCLYRQVQDASQNWRHDPGF
jgi:hypothetical protein